MSIRMRSPSMLMPGGSVTMDDSADAALATKPEAWESPNPMIGCSGSFG